MADECTCAPCCRCGYDGNDSDGADCYGQKPSVEKAGLPGVRFYEPHCFCWHASPGDCPVCGEGYPFEEAVDGLEPCPNAPYRLAPANVEKPEESS